MRIVKKFSEEELLQSLRLESDNNEVIRSIYRNYFESLTSFILNNKGTRSDAEDIFQEVVVIFIQLVKSGKFRGESSVKTFLFSLNKHLWLNELKRKGRAMQRESKYEREKELISIDESDFITAREMNSQIMKLIEQLGETCKKILVLFYYYDLSMKEILESLEYQNEQVVRNKKHKCLKKLQKMIDMNLSLKDSLKTMRNE